MHGAWHAKQASGGIRREKLQAASHWSGLKNRPPELHQRGPGGIAQQSRKGCAQTVRLGSGEIQFRAYLRVLLCGNHPVNGYFFPSPSTRLVRDVRVLGCPGHSCSLVHSLNNCTNNQSHPLVMLASNDHVYPAGAAGLRINISHHRRR